MKNVKYIMKSKFRSDYQRGLFCMVLLLLFTGPSFAQDSPPKQLPDFGKFYSYTDTTTLRYELLPDEGYVLFDFYDPGCGHCQQLGQSILENMDALKNTTVYFISMMERPQVDDFLDRFAPGLRNHKNVQFFWDKDFSFIQRFFPQNFPSVYLYDAKSKKLIAYLDGEKSIVGLLPYLKDN